MGGNNPFAPSGDGGAGGNGGGSSALLESLLGGMGSGFGSPPPSAGDGGGSAGVGGLGDLGGLASLLGAGGSGSTGGKPGVGAGLDSLAKSLLKNLYKRIEDESTQETVCRYLNGADPTQIRGVASMAGVPLSESAAARIAAFAGGVTPVGIRRSVKLAKRSINALSVVRKVLKVFAKYRHLIVLAVLAGWMKSAVLRPVVKVSAKKLLKGATATAAAAAIAEKVATKAAAAEEATKTAAEQLPKLAA